jgi:hypothetical protein
VFVRERRETSGCIGRGPPVDQQIGMTGVSPGRNADLPCSVRLPPAASPATRRSRLLEEASAPRRADREGRRPTQLLMSAGPGSGFSAPLALCIMARNGLANLSGDPLRSVRSGPARRPRPGPQGPQPDQLGKVADGLQRPATAGTEIAQVIGRVALAPHPGPAGHAPRVGHARSRFRRAIARSGFLRRPNGSASCLVGGVATSRTLAVTRWSGRVPVPVRSSVVR